MAGLLEQLDAERRRANRWEYECDALGKHVGSANQPKKKKMMRTGGLTYWLYRLPTIVVAFHDDHLLIVPLGRSLDRSIDALVRLTPTFMYGTGELICCSLSSSSSSSTL